MADPRARGLTILPAQGCRSIGIAILLGLAFGLWIGLADQAIFASAIPGRQRELFGETTLRELLPQLALYVVYQEAVLRLGLMTLTAWAIGRLRGNAGPATMWAAIVLTAAGFWPLVASAYLANIQWTGFGVLRELALHVPAGVLWGWLYWRHGWLAALAGHLASYATILPLTLA